MCDAVAAYATHVPFFPDIIIASPLGLRMIVGTDSDKLADRDYDFLSSIELLYLDRADVFSMQNFEHVDVVMSAMNRVPYQSRDADFSRIR